MFKNMFNVKVPAFVVLTNLFIVCLNLGITLFITTRISIFHYPLSLSLISSTCNTIGNSTIAVLYLRFNGKRLAIIYTILASIFLIELIITLMILR